MRLKKLGAALVVVVALGAFLASSALAAAVTEDVVWLTGESPGIELSGSESVGTEQVGESTFATTVSGQAVVLHSTGINCVECKIENSGSTAVGSGKLEFTGVTVEKPAHCTTSSTITTNALSVQPDWMIESADYIKLVPSAGEEKGLVSFTLSGAECPLSTTIIPKGSVFVQSANATETQAVAQQVNSSGTINSTAGGTFHVGTEAASLTATAKFKMSGAQAGRAVGVGRRKQFSITVNEPNPTGRQTIKFSITKVVAGDATVPNLGISFLPMEHKEFIGSFGEISKCEKTYHTAAPCEFNIEYLGVHPEGLDAFVRGTAGAGAVQTVAGNP